MKTDFSAARAVAKAIEVVGWILLVVAVGTALILYGSRDYPLVLVGSLGIVVLGVIFMAAAQLMRAQIVTAESSERAVELLTSIAASQQSSEGSGLTR